MENYLKFIFAVLTVMTINFGAHAQITMPETIDIALSKTYIPKGFDTNDRAQVMIEGYLPNTCYKLGMTEARVDEEKNQVVVTQHAYFYKSTLCLMIIIPFNRTVDLGILKQGSYSVVDGHSQQAFGDLPISPTLNSGPDDYLYAMVDDAHLGVQDNVQAILIRGHLPGNCWYVKEQKVIVEGEDVITILPVMGYHHGDLECIEVNTPFLVSTKLPSDLKKGRYMVQVRSLNGQSVNKLMDL